MSKDSNKESYDVFISYALDDLNKAKVIADKCKRIGFNVWTDESDIVPGEPWRDKLEHAIKSCDVVIILISKKALLSDWINKEWSIICEEKWNRPNITILPIKLEDIKTPPFLCKYNEYNAKNSFIDYEEITKYIRNNVENKFIIDVEFFKTKNTEQEFDRLVNRVRKIKESLEKSTDDDEGSRSDG